MNERSDYLFPESLQRYAGTDQDLFGQPVYNERKEPLNRDEDPNQLTLNNKIETEQIRLFEA